MGSNDGLIQPPSIGPTHPAVWTIWFYCGGAFAFLLAALVCHIFGNEKDRLDKIAQHICDDMDEIESWFPRAPTPDSPARRPRQARGTATSAPAKGE
jgi:hypothetical protein